MCLLRILDKMPSLEDRRSLASKIVDEIPYLDGNLEKFDDWVRIKRHLSGLGLDKQLKEIATSLIPSGRKKVSTK